MAETFSLRCYCYLDRMQPQYAAFVGTVTQGDLPTEGMAALYVEMAPGNEVFRMVDIAVKATEARPGAQIVEREFGMFEVHSPNQAAVHRSRECGPGPAGPEGRRTASARRWSPPRSSPASIPTSRSSSTASGAAACWCRAKPCWCWNAPRLPTSTIACNEAEKKASIKLIHVSSVGRFGRMWLSGTEAKS